MKVPFTILILFSIATTLTACRISYDRAHNDTPIGTTTTVTVASSTQITTVSPTTTAADVTAHPTSSALPDRPLTLEQAKAAALAHAKVDSADAVFVKETYERDGNTPSYELEFIIDGAEFEYTIHAEDGKVLKYEKELVADNAIISLDRAKGIAYAHAEITKDTVFAFQKEVYKQDNGTVIYKLRFSSGHSNYEYHIHAKSGEILTHEKRHATTYIPSRITTTTRTTVPPNISANRAKAIAFEHANVQAMDVYGLSVEFERERGSRTYEVEFHVRRTEYDYTIHADSGEVLHFHKESKD